MPRVPRTAPFVRLPYYCNCVNWVRADVHAEGGLCAMIAEAVRITRRTFLQHVNRDDHAQQERALGYYPHDRTSPLTMRRDHHVSYHRSRLHGKTVYFFKHSAIEYVYATND